MATTTFEYKNVALRDVSTFSTGDASTGKRWNGGIRIDNEVCKPTRRFWNSFNQRFRLSPNVYRYFNHDEVFKRVASVVNNDEMRVTIERTKNDFGKDVMPTLLGVSSVNGAIVQYDALKNLMLGRLGLKECDLRYSNGAVTTTHKPRIGAESFMIGGDKFSNQFTIHCPIDGYGSPGIYLGMLRQICSNGAIGMSQAFRSEINIGSKGDDPTYALNRACENFNSEEGFSAIKQRFESAMQSWSSMRETKSLRDLVMKFHYDNSFTTDYGRSERYIGGDGTERWTDSPCLKSFADMVGDIRMDYGVSSLDVIGNKAQRLLATKARVMDLINFASEMSTHHLNEDGSRRTQAWIGTLISESYDLEGTVVKFPDFRDFFAKQFATIKAAEPKTSAVLD